MILRGPLFRDKCRHYRYNLKRMHTIVKIFDIRIPAAHVDVTDVSHKNSECGEKRDDVKGNTYRTDRAGR